MNEEEQIGSIFSEVGRALHNWSRVEGAITSVLWRCMGTATPAPATIVWSNVISLAPKLNIVSQMLPLLVSDRDALALWSKLSDAVSVRNRSRNNLAHYEIVRFDNGPRLVPKYQSADMGSLAHADTDKSNAFERLIQNFETRGYTVKDIVRIADKFAELKLEISWYVDWVISFKRIPREMDLDPPKITAEFLSKLPPIKLKS